MEIKQNTLNITKIKRKSYQLSSSIDSLSDIIEKKINFKDIIKNTLDGKIPSELRSINWRIFLNIIPIDEFSNWESCVIKSREKYYEQCKKNLSKEFIEFTYLSKSDQKNHVISKTYSPNFVEMLNIIKLDIDRTFQEIDLFRDNVTKESLSRILYNWTINNQDVNYCQGMNEILGTIYYALFPSIIFDNVENKFSKKYSVNFYMLNSQDHFESDIYEIFTQLMKNSFKNLYNYNDIKYKENYKHGLVDGFEVIDKTLLTIEDINNSNQSPLKKRINKIFYLYLRIVDKELFLHIYDKVEPYIFLFRWVLCILNREISLKSIVYVWDCIFAIEALDFYKSETEEHFNFLDFMCVSMICNLKDELMQDDDPCYILSLLMHYPNENNIKEIIVTALAIRDIIYDYYQVGNEFEIVDFS